MSTVKKLLQPSPENPAKPKRLKPLAPVDVCITKDISTYRGKLTTTTMAISKRFGKLHKNVLRDIRLLECSEEFSRLNFEPANYLDERGKVQPMYNVTAQGFQFIVQAFTGREAAKWREAYIMAFQRLQNDINSLRANKLSPEWNEARQVSKDVRRDFGETLKRFVDYAIAGGSNSAKMYYVNVSKMEHAALFLLDSSMKTHFRDRLTALQLSKLASAEIIVIRTMEKGMAEKKAYKEIYQDAKKALEMFSSLIGKTSPGSDEMPDLIG